MDIMVTGTFENIVPVFSYVDICFRNSHLILFLQHLYVYGVLVIEAMATFIGQLSVLSLIAIFGAANTAMVN